jgi:hypothetical protein
MKKRLLQLFYVLSIAGVLTFFVTGCLWGFGQKAYVTVKYYDLDTPAQIVLKKIQVKFLPLDSTEPSKYKMVYRDANGQMLIDDYNKWIQTPSLLLTRYLQSAFKQDDITPETPELIISGNIFMFRIDLQKNTASLGVNYAIKTSDDDTFKIAFKNSTVFSSKFEKHGPKYFVEAMSKCAGKLISALQKDIKRIQLHRRSKREKFLSVEQLAAKKKSIKSNRK